MKREMFIKIVASVLAALMILSIVPMLFANADSEVEALLDEMTDEEKIAQLIMPAYRYWTDGSGKQIPLTVLPDELRELSAKYGFAGIVFFAQNCYDNASAAKLVSDIQTANSPHPTQLLTAIDQEGGIVTRLGHGTQMPGNMALGAAGDSAYTVMAAGVIADEISTLGFNLDFAPVVDVNVNPANPVIGLRSFSDDPETAAERGVAFMTELMSAGVISSLKHFPGHGDTDTDSHTGLPVVNRSYEELKEVELVPFKACIDAGAEVVMTAHIGYPQLEKETFTTADGAEAPIPATLSGTILTDVLRGDLGFEGVVITDAMNMDAISKNFGIVEASCRAIEAGADIILMPVTITCADDVKTLEDYISALTELLRSGELSREKVDASVRRVLTLKYNHGLFEKYEPRETDVYSVGSSEHHDVEWEIAKRAVTLVKNANSTLPIDAGKGKTVILTAYNNEILSMQYGIGRLIDEGKLTGAEDIEIVSYQNMTAEEMENAVAGADHVVIISEMGSASYLQKTRNSGKVDAVIAAAHSRGADATVLSVQLPYDAARFPEADAVLIAWSAKGMSEDPRSSENGTAQYGANMPAAIYLALNRFESPEGTLPVNIPEINGDGSYSDTVQYPRGFGLRYDLDPVKAFTDLDPEAWYAGFVREMLGRGIMGGCGGGIFAPHDPTSRAMLVTMLWRLAGENYVNYQMDFEDVPENEWYTEAVRWAASEGITDGYDEKTFAPHDPVTREQTAAILFRFFGGEAPETGLDGFADAGSVSQWAVKPLAWAVERGIITGTEEKMLLPRENAARSQIAAMLSRSMAE